MQVNANYYGHSTFWQESTRGLYDHKSLSSIMKLMSKVSRLYEKVCIQVSGLDQQLNVKKDTHSNIETPKGQYVTSVPKVYAAKDCHHGQS